MKKKSKKEVERMLDDLKEKGLIAEGPLKNGQRTWYIPDDKKEVIEKTLKETEGK